MWELLNFRPRSPINIGIVEYSLILCISSTIRTRLPGAEMSTSNFCRAHEWFSCCPVRWWHHQGQIDFCWCSALPSADLLWHLSCLLSQTQPSRWDAVSLLIHAWVFKLESFSSIATSYLKGTVSNRVVSFVFSSTNYCNDGVRAGRVLVHIVGPHRAVRLPLLHELLHLLHRYYLGMNEFCSECSKAKHSEGRTGISESPTTWFPSAVCRTSNLPDPPGLLHKRSRIVSL